MTGFAYAVPVMAQPVALSPATMQRVATVDQRYQSYNVEMAEVIGGKFWKPYDSRARPRRTRGKRLTGLHRAAPLCRPTLPCSRRGLPST